MVSVSSSPSLSCPRLLVRTVSSWYSGRYPPSARLPNWYTPTLPSTCHPVSRSDPVLETRKAIFKCSLATLWVPA